MCLCYRPDMMCSFPRRPTWRWDGEVAAGRRRALRCCGAGLRSRPEWWEEWGVGPRKGRWCRGGGLEAERRRDGEGPRRRRSQGEILGLDGGEETGRCSVRSLSILTPPGSGRWLCPSPKKFPPDYFKQCVSLCIKKILVSVRVELNSEFLCTYKDWTQGDAASCRFGSRP